MGEYATIQGTELKLGTMDDFRYVRHDEVEKWHGEGSADLAEYLADESTLYRFPFPWEDGQSVDQAAQRNMFEPVIVLRSPQFEGLEHHPVCKGFSFPGGGYNVNLYVPCPFTLREQGPQAGNTTLCSSLPEFHLRVYGERWAGSEGRTIFACPYCEHLYSLDAPHIEALRVANEPTAIDLKNGQDLRPVLSRLKARQS